MPVADYMPSSVSRLHSARPASLALSLSCAVNETSHVIECVHAVRISQIWPKMKNLLWLNGKSAYWKDWPITWAFTEIDRVWCPLCFDMRYGRITEQNKIPCSIERGSVWKTDRVYGILHRKRPSLKISTLFLMQKCIFISFHNHVEISTSL